MRRSTTTGRAARVADPTRWTADGWDGSTKATDDDVGQMEKVAKTRQAEDFLREHPDMLAVHSMASVRALMAKSEAGIATVA